MHTYDVNLSYRAEHYFTFLSSRGNERANGRYNPHNIIDLRTNFFISTSNNNVTHRLNLLQRVSTIGANVSSYTRPSR